MKPDKQADAVNDDDFLREISHAKEIQYHSAERYECTKSVKPNNFVKHASACKHGHE